MRQVSLREFRTRGSSALKSVPRGETVLLSGQDGPAYFLIPVFGDIAAEERDLRLAMARASLRAQADWIKASGLPILSDDEIDAEIAEARKEALPRARPKRR